MDLRQLRALVAIAEQGSFSAAADHLGTVQSNVSAHVAKLERELRCTLVDRAAGRLTAEGEIVLARAYRALAELDALAADIGASRQEVAGTVRIGMIGTTARWLAPIILADVSARHPRLRLVVIEGTTSGLEPQLAGSRIDLAVLTLPTPGRDLTSEPLFEEDLVLVAPVDDDPVAGRQRLALAELAGLDLLLPATGTPFRSEIDAAGKPAGVRLRSRAELDGVRLIASLTFEGYGPSILPATAVPRHLRPRFRLVPIDGLQPRQVGLAVRSRGLLSAPARAVADALRRRFSDGDGLPDGLRPLSAAMVDAEGSLRRIGAPNG